MSTKLNGNKFSPSGSRVPTDLLPTAIRYEAARAVIFEDWGNFVRANECLALKRCYERRAMEECISEPPTVAKDSDPGPT
ncbi:hypothetical protein [uncultured phage MedDCM-OCT-S05-C22]|nr:hypothetical protein [uncultured phage MedDCM-OCT-S05-C22]BAR24122.1 hypothetical protein [uncultured Mediterranean phage uvMED]BAR24140.1 hypothetical protein [uncultured Mediterranean phage uvMED]BAR24154.1 hypothetical protein [uncultured Mediterranean phage uvMED]